MAERRTQDAPAEEKTSLFGKGRRPAETRVREVAPAAPASGRRPPRQAQLRLTHVDPWSVTKAAFVLSIVLGVVAVVAVFIIWTVLGAAGLWDAINSAMAETLGDTDGQSFTIEDYAGTARAVGFTMIVAVVDVVLLTVIATLGAFLYNLAASLLGGVELTLTEDE